MRIAVNLRQFLKGRIGGQENYVVNVVGGLAAAGHSLTIFAQRTEFEAVRSFAPRAELLEPGPEGGSAIMERLRQGWHDLLYSPLLVLEPLDPPIPSAVMIPDLQHEFYPEFFSRPVLEWRRRTFLPSAVNSSVVFTCSEFTKRTIADRFGIPGGKVEVIPHAVDAEFRIPSSERERAAFQALALPGDYLYFPANFWPHKNHSNLFKALRLLHRRGHDGLHLVLTGAPGSDRDRVAAEIASLGLEKRVRLLGYQERGVVAEIYRHARALVFATLFEGFGIPVLEAMHLGVPVVTSRGGSTEEIADGAAILVNERIPESIAEGIADLLDDEALRAALVKRGLERAAGFTWEESVRRTIEVLERITSPGYRKPAAIMTEEYPAISVTTPSFNMARFLERTIESVLAQDYPRVDYMVMDGGSRDGTLEILRKYEGRIRWRSEPDRGQADAVNKGFRETKGPVFAFLNADDTYRPGALAAIGEAFRRNPRAGMVYGEAYYIDEKDEIIGRYTSLPFDYEELKYRCYICQPAAFVSREAFERAGMLDASLHYALDFDLWLRLGAENQVVKIPDYIANSRMYLVNKTLRAREAMYWESINAVRRSFQYVPVSWWNGYACYLLDRKDQFFERSRQTGFSHLLSLYLGLRHNPGFRKRYVREWANYAGLAGAFEGRWEDGWVSRRHSRLLAVPHNGVRLRVGGRHASPFFFPLRMTVGAEGQNLGSVALKQRGPFEQVFDIPAALRGRDVRLELSFNKSWVPGGGDYRHLSCVIDSLRVETEG